MEDMLGTYRYEGFSIREISQNIIGLFTEDNIRVAIFNKASVSKETIQTICSEWSFRTKRRRGDYGKPRDSYRRHH